MLQDTTVAVTHPQINQQELEVTDAHLGIIVSQVPTPQVPVPQATSSQVTKLRMSHGVYCVQEESTVTHQVYLQKMVTVMQVIIVPRVKL